MKRIMIDIDDVITDTRGFLKIVNDFLNSNYTIDDVDGYYIQDLVPVNLREKFNNYMMTQNLYQLDNINNDCAEVIKRLNETYDIYICSAFVYRDKLEYSGKLLTDKFDFLTRNFSFLDPNHFTFQTNKSIFNCHIKIDDKIENLEGAELKILFTAYHNKHLTEDYLNQLRITRVHNWLEIEEILKEGNN